MNNEQTPLPELLESAALTVTQIACAVHTSEAWVVQRVSGGILQLGENAFGPDSPAPPPQDAPQTWRFTPQTLQRARRIAELERIFDADPELAALTADLMEEVHQLRKRLERL